MNLDTAAQLRAPFAPEKIGKLPRVTCGQCRDSRDRSCDNHKKSKCAECGNWISSAHIHLDFVGHADATDRFLQVDPDWTWEPMALDANGLPAFDANGGLWIRLTIAGTTRLGYGDADGKKGANAIKEAIGDALRNAGLRFGVALDLWRKEAAVEVSNHAPAPPPPKQWDPIEQETLFVGYNAEIEDAKDQVELKAIAGRLRSARSGGELSPATYEKLFKAGAGRLAEMQQAMPA